MAALNSVSVATCAHLAGQTSRTQLKSSTVAYGKSAARFRAGKAFALGSQGDKSRNSHSIVSVNRNDPLACNRSMGAKRGSVICNAEATSTPAAPAESSNGISESDAVMNVIKAIMGAGAFALPWAYAQTGLIFTSVYMVAASLVCLYCINLMTKARVALTENNKDPALAKSFSSYSGYAKNTIGPAAGTVVDLVITTCCFGICSAYLVFVASTIHTLVPSISQNQFVLGVTPVMVLLSWLRDFSALSFVSVLGNVSCLVGLCTVIGFGMMLPAQWGAIPLMNVSAFPAAFGSVAFLFFVHFTMPAIESAMAEPEKFEKAAWVGFSVCTVVSAAFGTLGAAYFGPNVNSVIIAMLSGAAVVTAVKLLLCVNLLCTFPLVCRGAFDILENLLGGPDNLSTLTTRSMRSSFVIGAAAVAVGIPSFGKLLGLVGGVSCTFLTMVFPPLMFYFGYKKVGKPHGVIELIMSAIILVAGVAIATSALLA